MYILISLTFLLKVIVGIDQKVWYPKYENQSSFDEPFDYVSDSYLPNLTNDETFDWISSSGTTLFNFKKSYFAFTGTRKNKAKDISSVYTKELGLLVLCESSDKSSQTFDLNIRCKILESNGLKNNEGIYFGSVVRSVQYKEDTAAFIYCDPLWIDSKSKYKEPSGKCNLSFIKDFNVSKKKDFQVCDSFTKCLGGFSVDIFSQSGDLNVIFGLPFSNSTLHLKQAQSYGVSRGVINKGNFFNFGYSVAFANDGSMFVSSPVSDEKSAFVEMLNAEKFYPQNLKTQNYGGFGISIDTVKISNGLYGVIIGSPYQSKLNIPNVGAVSLACKGHVTDIVMGENKYDYFGYAVARIGDLDDDGAEEFAVSAPSLNLDKPGKIYIYKTTSTCQIQKNPIQIYQSKINGFGVSITRGFDIDFNGSPDFFVTSLNAKKPSLFTMPSRQTVNCIWVNKEFGEIFLKDKTFDVKIWFKSEAQINFDDYLFQVALDFLNKGENRFELVKTQFVNKVFTLTIKTLSDVIDIDLKSIPLKLEVKGTRQCKQSDSDNCFKSKAFNIRWLDCENTIKLTQYVCNYPSCLSDLALNVKPDTNGTTIYLGNTTNYQRTLEVTISNDGPEVSPRIYMTINNDPDIEITNVKCNDYKHIVTISSNDKPSVIAIKDNVNPRNDVKILVEMLYRQLNVTKSKTTIQFKVWGINNDDNLANNSYDVHYSVLFKPNLLFSSKKAPDTIVDPRLKPPYLEAYKRVQVHELGTNLQYSYLIENKGPELSNVTFKFKFPYKTKDNKFILYMMDKIRLSIDGEWLSALPKLSRNNKEVGTCSFEKEYINPLQVIAVESHKHVNGETSASPKRLRRSVIGDRIVTYVDDGNHTMDTVAQSRTEMAPTQGTSDRSTTVKCGTEDPKLGTPKCGVIRCTLAVVPVHSVFNFDFRAWLFTETFFSKKVADLVVVTSLESDLGDLPSGLTVAPDQRLAGPFSVAQKVIFSRMVIRPDKPLPLWPIILAAIIGIILLAVIIIIAYNCGFFKRKRLQQEKNKGRTRAKNGADSATAADKYPLTSST